MLRARWRGALALPKCPIFFRPRFARLTPSPLPSRFLVRRFSGRASRGTFSLLGTELSRFSRARVRTRTVTSKSVAHALTQRKYDSALLFAAWLFLKHRFLVQEKPKRLSKPLQTGVQAGPDVL